MQSCATCKHFSPMRVAAAMDYRVQRWRPCEVSDFLPELTGQLQLPMTDDAFNAAVQTYACYDWSAK